MKTMTESEWREFASAGGRLGEVAISRADGRPHVTPVWFVLDGNDLVFTSRPRGVKVKSLLRDPRIAVCVNDETYPYNFVLIEGEASISRDHDEHRRLAIAIGERYTGSDDEAEDFADSTASAGYVLVRVRITKVIAHRDVAEQ
jgi:PPOX class probable F420-dependent enzyme